MFRRTQLLKLPVVLAALVLWSAQAVAQQNFSLTMQPRTPAYDTARAKIAFDSSGLDAGATVKVGTGAAIAVPAAVGASAAGGTGTAGEFVQVIRRTATRVHVVWTAAAAEFGGNWCSSPRVADKVVSIALSGVNATGYRFAGYTAPGAENCSNPYRRVRSQVQLAGPLGVTNSGRLPLDVVLVLDKSGSMGWQLPGGAAGETRWSRLGSSVGQFMGLWQQAVAAGVEGSDDDRIGLVFFNEDAEDAILDAGSIFKKRSAAPANWAHATPPPADIVSAQVAARSPGGATSIGDGTQRARDRWDALAAGEKNDPTIVVFTDGEQNTASLIAPDAGTSAPLKLNAMKLAEWGIPVLTIGLGASGGPFADLLDQVASETAGRSRITTGGLALDLLFADQLVEALKGNTLSLAARLTETLPATGNGTPLPVLLDGSVKRATFVLGWESGRSALMLRLVRPDGTVVNPVVSSQGELFVVASADIPASGPTGTWQVQAVRGQTTAGPVKYHLSAYAAEGRLDYRYAVTSTTVGTGQQVTLRAHLAYDGRALDKLPSGAIRVTVERPGENLGNILADSQSRGDPRTVNGDTQSAVSTKIDLLARTDNLIGRIEPKPVPKVPAITELGNGVYEITFDETIIGGQYRFRVDLDWNDARTGRIKRTEIVERQVPVVPSVADSVTQLTRDPKTGTARIVITPKDRFGNLVGPGYADRFTVELQGVGTVSPVRDPATRGLYTIDLSGLPAGLDPRITIGYRGAPLRRAPLSLVERPELDPKKPLCGALGLGSMGAATTSLALIALVVFRPRRIRQDETANRR